MGSKKTKIVVIVGPTASGKTSLSIAIAKQFTGEVISADSRQVYKGLDIGSGKVTAQEMDKVPHHLLDIADIQTVYTAANFKNDAAAKIADITDRHKLPIIAGGTFMYVDTLLGRITTPEVAPNETFRASIEHKSTVELFTELQQRDPARASRIDSNNRRRLERALEIVNVLGVVPEIQPNNPYDTLTIGIEIQKEQLHENIHVRLLERFQAGMVGEVENLLADGVTHDRLEKLGLEYRYISRYLRNELQYEEMVEMLETKIKQFAKRQMTWLKRDDSIHWMKKDDFDSVFSTVSDFLKN